MMILVQRDAVRHLAGTLGYIQGRVRVGTKNEPLCIDFEQGCFEIAMCKRISDFKFGIPAKLGVFFRKL